MKNKLDLDKDYCTNCNSYECICYKREMYKSILLTHTSSIFTFLINYFELNLHFELVFIKGSLFELITFFPNQELFQT